MYDHKETLLENIAKGYYNLKQYPKALPYLEELIQLDPLNIDHKNNLKNIKDLINNNN